MTEKDYNLIEAFLDGTLNTDQKKELELRLKDESFARELHTQLEMVKGVKSMEKEKLKSEYKSLLKDSTASKPRQKIPSKYLWGALILLLLLLIYFA